MPEHYDNPYLISDNGDYSIGWRLVINIHDLQHSITAGMCAYRLFKTLLRAAQLAQEVERPAVNHEVVGSSIHYD